MADSKDMALLMTLSAVLIWAISFPLIKIAVGAVEPVLLGALRSLVFIPMLMYLLIARRAEVFRPSRTAWLIFIGVGVFAVGLPNVLQNIGMKYTTASVTSIIQSTGPIFTIVLAVLILKESLGWKRIAGTIIALIGAVLLITGGELTFSGAVYGNVLILLSAISYAIASIITKKGLDTLSPITMLGCGTMVGFIFLLVTSVGMGEDIYAMIELPVAIWFVIFLLAVFPSFIGVLLWYTVLVREELSRLILFIYLMPVFSVLFSFIILNEIIELLTVFFAVLTISGVALAQIRNKTAQEASHCLGCERRFM